MPFNNFEKENDWVDIDDNELRLILSGINGSEEEEDEGGLDAKNWDKESDFDELLDEEEDQWEKDYEPSYGKKPRLRRGK